MADPNYASTSHMPYSGPNPFLTRPEHLGNGNGIGNANGSINSRPLVFSQDARLTSASMTTSTGSAASQDDANGPYSTREWHRQPSIDSTASEGSHGEKRRSKKIDASHPGPATGTSQHRKSGSGSSRKADETEEEKLARRARREKERVLRLQTTGFEEPSSSSSRHRSRPSNSSRSSAGVSSPIASESAPMIVPIPSLDQHGTSSSTPGATSKSVLTIALQRAQSAVLLDSANNVPAAITAYEQSVSLLKEVMARVEEGAKRERQRAKDKDMEGLKSGEGEEDRMKRQNRAERKEKAKLDEARRLKVIHDTYEDRIGMLVALRPGANRAISEGHTSHTITGKPNSLPTEREIDYDPHYLRTSLLPTTSVSPFVAEPLVVDNSSRSSHVTMPPNQQSLLPTNMRRNEHSSHVGFPTDNKALGSPIDPLIWRGDPYERRGSKKEHTRGPSSHEENDFGSSSQEELSEHSFRRNPSNDGSLSLSQQHTPFRSESVTPRAGGSFSSVVTAKESASQYDHQGNVTDSIRSAHRKLASISSLDHPPEEFSKPVSKNKTPDIVLQTDSASSSSVLDSYTIADGYTEGSLSNSKSNWRENPYEELHKNTPSNPYQVLPMSQQRSGPLSSSVNRLQSQDGLTDNVTDWYKDQSRSQDQSGPTHSQENAYHGFSTGTNVSSKLSMFGGGIKKAAQLPRDAPMLQLQPEKTFSLGPERSRPHPIRSASLAVSTRNDGVPFSKATEHRADMLRQNSSPPISGHGADYRLPGVPREEPTSEGNYVVADAANEDAMRLGGRRRSSALSLDQGEFGKPASGNIYHSASLPSRMRNTPQPAQHPSDKYASENANESQTHSASPILPTTLNPYSLYSHRSTASHSSHGSLLEQDLSSNDPSLLRIPHETNDISDVGSATRPYFSPLTSSAVFSFESPPSAEPTTVPTSPLRRPFHLMHLLLVSIESGGFLTPRLHISKQVWLQTGVKLPNMEAKARTLELLSTGLEDVGRVGEDMLPPATSSKSSVKLHKELESLEGMLDGIQNTLGKKLGLMNAPTKKLGSSLSAWSSKISKGLDKVTTSRIDSPSLYVDSISRTLKRAQTLDLHITCLLESQGGYAMLGAEDRKKFELRFRKISEFFDNFFCRFVLQDLGMLVDKFVKRSGASLGAE